MRAVSASSVQPWSILHHETLASIRHQCGRSNAGSCGPILLKSFWDKVESSPSKIVSHRDAAWG
jgi:hypothetical protein